MSEQRAISVSRRRAIDIVIAVAAASKFDAALGA
jgi:hypothetical protein